MSEYLWSKSSLKSLLDGCSWQWALRKIYEIEDHGSPATALGTGVHKAIEEWERSGRNLSLKELQSVAAEESFAECKKLPVEMWFEHGTDPEQTIDFAKESVRIWWDTPVNKGSTIREMVSEWKWLGSEVYWQNAFAEFNIHGFIDSVYEDERHVIVVDNKTAGSMRRWKYDQDMNIETAMYLALAHKAQNDGLLPDKQIMFQYHIVSAKENKSRIIDMGYLDGNAWKLLFDALTEASAIKKHDAYRPRPDWNLCSRKWCTYFDGCRVNGTLTPYNLTVTNKPSSESPPMTDEEAEGSRP